jgi:enoyl-CoA hydratase/carnithine racemase
MFDAAYETLICDQPRPHVARIVLNREKQMNAYNWRMTQERRSGPIATTTTCAP